MGRERVAATTSSSSQAVAEQYGVDLDTPWQDLPAERPRPLPLRHRRRARSTSPTRNRFGRQRSYTTRFEGIVPNLERRYRETDSDDDRARRSRSTWRCVPCPACKGARLRPESLAVHGRRDRRSTSSRALSARAARCAWLDELELTETERHDRAARSSARSSERLRFLDNVGDRLPVARPRRRRTLSGGEAQRIRLATQIGSSLVGVLYILDEPSIGLHQRDNAQADRDARAPARPRQHRDRRRARRGHDARRRPPRRPRPGRRRARRRDRRRGHRRRRSSGSAQSLTGQFLAGHARDRGARASAARRAATLDDPRRPPAQPASGIDVQVPLGVFCCVTGVSGSGKSTLVNEIAATRRSPTACTARKLAARARTRAIARARAARQDHQHRPVADRPHAALEPGDLHRALRPHPRPLLARRRRRGRAATSRAASRFNVKGGRCEVCRATARSRSRCTSCPTSTCPCEQCHGKRYNRETLEVRFKGKTIADVLEMSVEEALEFFEHIPKIAPAPARRCTTSASTTSGSASRRRRSPAARRSG